MLILKNDILPRILIRRTKAQCADDLALPPRCVVWVCGCGCGCGWKGGGVGG